MENNTVHEIELYPFETFEILLSHDINLARRYGTPLTLVHLAVETDVSGPDAQHGAEIFAINALNLHIRDTDIPCRRDNEFFVLMPVTDEQGGRIVCERLEKLFKREAEIYDKVSFKLSAYIGMATLPGDKSLTMKSIHENAAKALAEARKKGTTNSKVFSDLK